MKKILCLLLALLTLALPLTACAKSYADDISAEVLSNAIVINLTGTIPDYSLADEGYLDDYITLPDYVTEKSVREGRLCRLDVPDVHVEIWKQMFYHRDKWVSPQMKIVMEYLTKK